MARSHCISVTHISIIVEVNSLIVPLIYFFYFPTQAKDFADWKKGETDESAADIEKAFVGAFEEARGKIRTEVMKVLS